MIIYIYNEIIILTSYIFIKYLILIFYFDKNIVLNKDDTLIVNFYIKHDSCPSINTLACLVK